ncbi:MAG: hypothetical protein HY289_16260 [Planctomycetes bacterium]|nr:hypothetical protein [Planctomycetota bacterium]
MKKKIPTVDEVASDLANKHFELEPGMQHIFRLRTKQAKQNPERIMLLEVNEYTVPGGIMPLYFGANAVIPYPCIIVEVTPEEYEKVKSKELKLPDGWKIGDEIQRPAETTEVK